MTNLIYRIYGELGKLIRYVEERRHPEYWREAPGLSGYTLYHFYGSYFSMKTRKAIYRIGLRIPFRDVLLDADAYSELITFGGKDQVPCLRIDAASGTTWMYESDDIIAYLEDQKRRLGRNS